MTDEVKDYAEAVVVGEAEDIWPQVIEDARRRRLQPIYRSNSQPDLALVRYDRSLFRGRRYLQLGLIETGRGCRFPCEFCAVQTFFQRTARHRPIDAIVAEIATLKSEKRLFFFVDDNFAADLTFARELAEALDPARHPLGHADEHQCGARRGFLAELKASGCAGVLIGFESLDENVLRAMRKTFNTMRGGFAAALANLRRHGIRVYGTFVFGYDGERADAFEQAAEFAIDHRFYLAAFNHLTPFPGTPLFARLQREGRLLYERWWLDERYGYNGIPFQPSAMAPDDIRTGCLRARRKFYSWASMARRAMRSRESRRRLHVPQFLRHQRHAPRRGRQARPLPTGRPDLERTVAQGGVSGPTFESGDLVFALAGRGDDADIRRLLRENATDGWIRLALAREPDAFAAAAVMGRAHAYVIARSRQSGEAVGVCEWSVREAFVDGVPQAAALSRRAAGRASPSPSHPGAARRLRGGASAVASLLGTALRVDRHCRRQSRGAARARRQSARHADLPATRGNLDLRAASRAWLRPRHPRRTRARR